MLIPGYGEQIQEPRLGEATKLPQGDQGSHQEQNLIKRVEALKMMKVLEKTPFIIPQVYQKLPEQLQLEWTLHRITVSKKDWAEFVIFLQIQIGVSIILQNMALSLGASDNSKASGKGGLTCHICSKTGHFAKECPDKRKPPKAGSNTATMSRYVCCYLQISEG